MKPVLAHLYEQAFTLTKALQHRDLTEADEASLAGRVAAGDRSAVDELTLCNARLAFSWARRFTIGGRVSVDDLFQEAWLGVRKAAERYNNSSKPFVKFSRWFIKERVLLFAYSFAFGPAEVPSKMMRIHRAVWRARGELSIELGRVPFAEEVAERADVSLVHARQFLLLGMETVSLHEPVNSERSDGATLLDTLADEVNEAAGSELAGDDVGEFLSALNDRQATVIKLRFGIGCGEPLENVEIAKRMNLTRERVRQLGDRAVVLLNGRKGWLQAQGAKRRSA